MNEQGVAEQIDLAELLGFKQNAIFDLLKAQMDRFAAADVRLGIVLAGLVAVAAIGPPSHAPLASVLAIRGVTFFSLLICVGAFLAIVPRGDHWAARAADYARHPQLVTTKILDEAFAAISYNDTWLPRKQAATWFGALVGVVILMALSVLSL